LPSTCALRPVPQAGRTRPARETFVKRFEKEVDPDGTLPPEERRRRAEHAKRAYMLQLAKRSAVARRARWPTPKNTTSVRRFRCPVRSSSTPQERPARQVAVRHRP
jgi:hypothetical protein